MAKENPIVLLRTIITSDKDYIDACLLEDACVICINRETKRNKFMPFRVMYDNNDQFWDQNKVWEYFLASDELNKIKERATKLKSNWEPGVIEVVGAETEKDEKDENAGKQGFGDEYDAIVTMTETERIQHIKESKSRLDKLIAQKPRQEQLITEALVETARDAVLHNHAALIDAMKLPADEAKKQTQDLVDSTRELVEASSQLITTNIFNDDLMSTLVSKSNGTIIQHMTRVYLKGLAFLTYYNKMVSTTSIINKLRIAFFEKYQPYYRILLPHIHLDDLTLEKVFLGGMRAIPENTFYTWALGFLIHDIGKAAAVEYHEGEAEYNRDIVMEHVKVGYTSVMNKTNYPKDVGLITGYHHEYYGDSSGYGFYRSGFDLNKKMNPQAKLNACITYEPEPMMEYEALAFFPAKILEIIDVFDSVTDSNRKYRKVLTTEEALAMMGEEFVIKRQKIDIILFDLFKKFLSELPSTD
jgi:HD-GYP domain-containing protein (c-di-GMP phosphodiesterase class II)